MSISYQLQSLMKSLEAAKTSGGGGAGNSSSGGSGGTGMVIVQSGGGGGGCGSLYHAYALPAGFNENLDYFEHTKVVTSVVITKAEYLNLTHVRPNPVHIHMEDMREKGYSLIERSVFQDVDHHSSVEFRFTWLSPVSGREFVKVAETDGRVHVSVPTEKKQEPAFFAMDKLEKQSVEQHAHGCKCAMCFHK